MAGRARQRPINCLPYRDDNVTVCFHGKMPYTVIAAQGAPP
jgi:hypothetical protein